MKMMIKIKNSLYLYLKYIRCKYLNKYKKFRINFDIKILITYDP
jgi:phage FluMu protein Com